MPTYADVINTARNQNGTLIVDISGDSTCLYKGWGHAAAMMETLRAYVPMAGLIRPFNYRTDGGNINLNQCWPRGRRNNTTAAGTTTGLPANLSGGYVSPANWDGGLPSYLANNAANHFGQDYWQRLYYDAPFGTHGELVASFWCLEMVAADSTEANASGSKLAWYSYGSSGDNTVPSGLTLLYELPASGRVPTSVVGGTAGTLRRIDHVKPRANVADADTGLLCGLGGTVNTQGPGCMIFMGVRNCGITHGFVGSWLLARGGRNVYNLLLDTMELQYHQIAMRRKFRAQVQMSDADWSNTWPTAGTPYGSTPPPGMGGNGQYQMLDHLAFGHNDVANTNPALVHPSSVRWAAEFQTTADTNTTTATTYNVTSAASFASAGVVTVVTAAGTSEYIRYTGKTATTLTGCTRQAFTESTGTGLATTAGTNTRVYQGYLGWKPLGYAANVDSWRRYRLAAWVAEGFPAERYSMALVLPPAVHDVPEYDSLATPTFRGRMGKFFEYEAAVRANVPDVAIVALHRSTTAEDLLAGAKTMTNSSGTTAANISATQVGTTTTLTTASTLGQTDGFLRITNGTATEWIEYSGATGSGTVTITIVRRGVFGTTPTAFSSGATFVEPDAIHLQSIGFQDAWRNFLAIELSGMALDTEGKLAPSQATRRSGALAESR